MKPTTEDFLIPLADAIRLFVNTEDVDFVQSATKARIHAARLAKMAHDEECQRLADQWVADHKTEFFERAMEYRRVNISARDFEYRHGLDELWISIRDKADPIFRDYVTKCRPQE